MPGLRRRAAYIALKAYKTALSPLFYMFGARCRHAPTCSEYAAEAVARHGVWPGGWMALARLCRCRPGGSSGWDPVPTERLRAPVWAPWAYGDWRSGERPAPKT